MTTTTPNLGLPFIYYGQASKEAQYNEAMRRLDMLVQLSVVSRTASLPATASEGTRYIVGDSIAGFYGGSWINLAPLRGWAAFVEDENARVWWNGSAWVEFGVETLSQLADVDVSTAQSGQYLAFNAASGKWQPVSVQEVLNQVKLVSLGDVDIPTAPSGSYNSVVVYNGSSQRWTVVNLNQVFQGAVYLDDLVDVDAASPAGGSVLTWDGSKWVPRVPTTVIPHIPQALNELSDVKTDGDDTPQGQDVLAYDDYMQQWRPVRPGVVASYSKLDDLSDVDAVGATDGQILMFEGATQRWRVVDLAAALAGRTLRHGAKYSHPTGGDVTINYGGYGAWTAPVWGQVDYDTLGFTRSGQGAFFVVPTGITRVRVSAQFVTKSVPDDSNLKISTDEGNTWGIVPYAPSIVSKVTTPSGTLNRYYVQSGFFNVQPGHRLAGPVLAVGSGIGATDFVAATWFEIEAF